MRRFLLPAAAVGIIALGIVLWYRQTDREPLTEAEVIAAVQQADLPLELAADETESWGEGHALYTLNGEDITVFVSSTIVDGERTLQLNCTSEESETPEFSPQDWEPYFSLASLLFDDGMDREELFGALSNEGMTEVTSAKEYPDGPLGWKGLRWKGQLSKCVAVVGWRRSASNFTRTFPSPIIHSWRTMLSIYIYESEDAYQNMVSGRQ